MEIRWEIRCRLIRGVICYHVVHNRTRTETFLGGVKVQLGFWTSKRALGPTNMQTNSEQHHTDVTYPVASLPTHRTCPPEYCAAGSSTSSESSTSTKTDTLALRFSVRRGRITQCIRVDRLSSSCSCVLYLRYVRHAPFPGRRPSMNHSNNYCYSAALPALLAWFCVVCAAVAHHRLCTNSPGAQSNSPDPPAPLCRTTRSQCTQTRG